MKIKAAITAIALLLLVSCGDDEKTETVKIGGKYLLELPSYLTKTKGLNDDASLEYQNAIRELYVVVIDEDKAELQKVLDENELYDIYPNDLDGYTKLVTENFEKGFSLDNPPVSKDIKINGLSAKVMSFEGKVDGIQKMVYYKMAFVEGKNRYYQVMTWTLAERKEKYEPVMQKMIDSFKEMDKSRD